MSHLSQTALAMQQSDLDAMQIPTGKLLIVDDLADNRDMLTRRFRRHGFEIVEADCGPEALRLVNEQTFDCVLLDVMMPGMDGTEVLRQIREKFSPSLLPVVMVTAKSQSEDIVDALKFGANDYVTKPVDFSVALARVVVQIHRRRADLELLHTNESLLKAKTALEGCITERSAKLLQANAAIQEEVSRRIASEDKIAYLAHYDTLTGLANRFTFDEKLNAAKQFAHDFGCQLSLLFVDLDGFKNVNDTLGHGVGDELLKEVAARLTYVIGAKDFCARLGGDEFAIVHVSEDARSTAASLAEKIITVVSDGHIAGGNQVFIGASIGISVLCGGTEDTAALVKHADLAMYRAKADGRGVYRFFEPEMGRQAEIRRSLELDLRKAVANGDFQLYYQPVVNLKARKVTGVEALMRWNHATRGFVSPIEFISLAEETGLIVTMGEWALRRACADATQWPDDIRVAVNLSPVQFRNTNLTTVVVDALGASGLAPDRLELEITESVILGDNSETLLILHRLRELGVRISLDDFGIGYSGLGYFRAVRFDKVKIDQSFIREMHNQPESLAIVRAAIGLGENLGICTTAEGVESRAQLERLLSEGCTEVQGFLFSKPQPNANVINMIKRIESMPNPEILLAKEG
ncbi:MAG: EAL domain-containing protein [Roseiarcus sp.]|jgi:diguanylate cyclase (GGDEF)-like protein